MKFLFGVLALIIVVSYSDIALAQNGMNYSNYEGTCNIEKVNLTTGEKQSFNMVPVTMTADYHEPNDSWEIVLQYGCGTGTCMEAVYLKRENANEFTGLKKGSINCQGTFVTENTSNGYIQGTMVTTKSTYVLTFKNIVFQPVVTLNTTD